MLLEDDLDEKVEEVRVHPALVYLPDAMQGQTQCRCRENMAYIRQSGPDSGVDFQVKVIKTFKCSRIEGLWFGL